MTQQPWGQPQPQQQFQPNPYQQPAPFAQAGQDPMPIVNATEVGGDGLYPSNGQLLGRLLLFTVTSFTPQVTGQYGVQDQIIADVAILDGPPITHKLNGRTGQPESAFPFPLEAPYVVRGATWSQKLVVALLKNHVGTGKPVIGRLTKGVKRGSNDAPLKLEPATEAEIQGPAMAYWRDREQIAARWAAKWEQFQGQQNQPPAPGPVGPPLPGAWNQQGAPQFYGQPVPPAQYGTPPQQPYQPAPVQDQPWNPYNGQQAPQGAPQPQPGTAAYGAQLADQQNHSPQGWNPEPQGAPAGWPTQNQ